MRAVVQRVTRARVLVDEIPVGEVGIGLCILVGVASGDDRDVAARLARKVARLRIFENDQGRFDRDLREVEGEALVVSQFTLISDTSRGNRPSFSDAAPPGTAELLYETFCSKLEAEGISVARGRFGARMTVEIQNDGPVTVVLDA